MGKHVPKYFCNSITVARSPDPNDELARVSKVVTVLGASYLMSCTRPCCVTVMRNNFRPSQAEHLLIYILSLEWRYSGMLSMFRGSRQLMCILQNRPVLVNLEKFEQSIWIAESSELICHTAVQSCLLPFCTIPSTMFYNHLNHLLIIDMYCCMKQLLTVDDSTFHPYSTTSHS